jgi:hypothetical protein
LGLSETAHRYKAGKVENDLGSVPIPALIVGDIFRVEAGETISSDGGVTAGVASVDESTTTGKARINVNPRGRWVNEISLGDFCRGYCRIEMDYTNPWITHPHQKVVSEVRDSVLHLLPEPREI